MNTLNLILILAALVVAAIVNYKMIMAALREKEIAAMSDFDLYVADHESGKVGNAYARERLRRQGALVYPKAEWEN